MIDTRPTHIQALERGIVASLERSSYSLEGRRIRNCRYHGRCHSVFCPHCREVAGYKRKDRLFDSVNQNPARRWKLFTLKAANMPLDQLRASAQSMMKSASLLLKRVKIADSAYSFETSFADWSDDAHPHIHLLADPPRGGRNHVPDTAWHDEWLEVLPETLHPSCEPVHIKLVETVEQECYYLCKSPFWHWNGIPSAGKIDKIIQSIRTLRSVKKFNLRGTLKPIAA